MAIATLLSIGANETRLSSVVEKLGTRNINFFVGAGFSVPCGMSSWTGFLRQLSRLAFVESDVRGGPGFRDRMAAWLRWILGSVTPPISPVPCR
jgi:hypothetical protein